MKRNFLVSGLTLGFLSVLSSAQVDISPGVARISLIKGDVSTQRGDTGDWSAAALNQPLISGDRISTGDNSKAELQLDHGNILRLGNNSQAKIATVEQVQNHRAHIQVQIRQGLIYYSVFKDSDAEVEIDTPNAAIRPTSKDGVYRMEVTGFETQVIVRAGVVDMATPQGGARLEMGQGATVKGTTHLAGNVLGGVPAMDSWDSWNIDRDGLINNAQSWNYTSRYYVGSEDLDVYGHWVNVPDYGRVWSPTVGAGWSPYRAGRWIWEPYWGWTWVSHEPWGWTPYHYGRWFLYGKSWMWWPGPVDSGGDYCPEWAPAYVSFFGFGGHRGVSGGFGAVGWLPLGPGDSFYPWYGQNGWQLKGSITDATNMTRLTRVVAPLRDDNEFSNVSLAAVDGRIREAISALPANLFGIGPSAPKTVSRRAFRDARIITGNLPIVPTREMLSATNRPANASSILGGGRQEQYFTTRQPATAPQSFDKEAAQVQVSIEGTGQLVPAREITQLNSVDTARPLALENGIERTVEPTRDAQGEHRSRAQPHLGLPAASSPGMWRSTRGMTTPAHAYRGAKTRTASRPDGNSHSAVPLRAPEARSTRRVTTLAAGSRGGAANAAQSYIESANRQLDKGNYTAAIANYKRALQVDRNNSAAKVCLGRARRAMQAENEIIASRR